MKLSGRHATGWLVAAVSIAALGACRAPSRSAVAERRPAGIPDTALAEQGYLAPPQVVTAEPETGAGVVLRGEAGAGAKIQLQSPEGDSRSTTARKSGAWTLRLPPVQRPRMFAMSEILDGRVVHAEGALIVLPRPGPAALLARAGFGALILDPSGAHPSLATIDYDPGGFAAFSGTAQPGSTVRLSLDGAPAGLAQVDSGGRYAVLAANHQLSFGQHVALIETGLGEIRRPFQLIAPGPLTSPYQASAEGGGWRVEWVATGGGVQTTLVLAPQ